MVVCGREDLELEETVGEKMVETGGSKWQR